MSSILAIDAGGSKCDAVVIGPDGGIQGWGNSCITGLGGRHQEAIRTAVARAVGKRPIHFGYVVASSIYLPLSLFQTLDMRDCQVVVCDEAQAAFAHGDADAGVVILAGTGAFVHGWTKDGRHRHLDGTGPILGDFGGGYHVGMMALNAVVRSDWHARHQTSLRGRLLEKFNVQSPTQPFLLNLFGQDRSVVASIARLVIEEDKKGDAVSHAIMVKAAETLGETFRDLTAGLEMADSAYPVFATGSILRCSDTYWKVVTSRIAEIAPRFTLRRLMEPPAVSLGIYALRKVQGREAAKPAVQRLLEEVKDPSKTVSGS